MAETLNRLVKSPGWPFLTTPAFLPQTSAMKASTVMGWSSQVRDGSALMLQRTCRR
jgi:hypothetical protein